MFNVAKKGGPLPVGSSGLDNSRSETPTRLSVNGGGWPSTASSSTSNDRPTTAQTLSPESNGRLSTPPQSNGRPSTVGHRGYGGLSMDPGVGGGSFGGNFARGRNPQPPTLDAYFTKTQPLAPVHRRPHTSRPSRLQQQHFKLNVTSSFLANQRPRTVPRTKLADNHLENLHWRPDTTFVAEKSLVPLLNLEDEDNEKTPAQLLAELHLVRDHPDAYYDAQLKMLRADNKRLAEERDDLQKRFDEQSEVLQDTQKELIEESNERARLEDEVDDLKEQIKKLMATIGELKDRIVALEKERDEIHRRLMDALEELENMGPPVLNLGSDKNSSMYCGSEDDSEDENALEVRRLRELMALMEEDLANLREELLALQKVNETLKQKIKDLIERINADKKLNEERDKELKALRERNKFLERFPGLYEAEKKITEAQKLELATSKMNLEKAQLEIERLNRALAALRKRLNEDPLEVESRLDYFDDGKLGEELLNVKGQLHALKLKYRMLAVRFKLISMQSKIRARKVKQANETNTLLKEKLGETQRDFKEAVKSKEESIQEARQVTAKTEDLTQEYNDLRSRYELIREEHEGCMTALDNVQLKARERLDQILYEAAQMKRIFMRSNLHSDVAIALTDRNTALMEKLAENHNELVSSSRQFQLMKKDHQKIVRHRDALHDTVERLKGNALKLVTLKLEVATHRTRHKLLQESHDKTQNEHARLRAYVEEINEKLTLSQKGFKSLKDFDAEAFSIDEKKLHAPVNELSDDDSDDKGENQKGKKQTRQTRQRRATTSAMDGMSALLGGLKNEKKSGRMRGPLSK